MLYKFKSKATGNVIMAALVGDSVLRAMGREPAAQGIFEAAAMPALLGALEAAVADDERRLQGAADEPTPSGSDAPGGGADKVSLKQRAWPLLEMMRRASSAGESIVWGV